MRVRRNVENAGRGKVWKGNVGWKCLRSVGKRREREGLERTGRSEV